MTQPSGAPGPDGPATLAPRPAPVRTRLGTAVALLGLVVLVLSLALTWWHTTTTGPVTLHQSASAWGASTWWWGAVLLSLLAGLLALRQPQPAVLGLAAVALVLCAVPLVRTALRDPAIAAKEFTPDTLQTDHLAPVTPATDGIQRDHLVRTHTRVATADFGPGPYVALGVLAVQVGLGAVMVRRSRGASAR